MIRGLCFRLGKMIERVSWRERWFRILKMRSLEIWVD